MQGYLYYLSANNHLKHITLSHVQRIIDLF